MKGLGIVSFCNCLFSKYISLILILVSSLRAVSSTFKRNMFVKPRNFNIYFFPFTWIQ